jgi:hypothetical protein
MTVLGDNVRADWAAAVRVPAALPPTTRETAAASKKTIFFIDAGSFRCATGMSDGRYIVRTSPYR